MKTEQYQPLFDHMSENHGLILFHAQMDNIIDLVHKYYPKPTNPDQEEFEAKAVRYYMKNHMFGEVGWYGHKWVPNKSRTNYGGYSNLSVVVEGSDENEYRYDYLHKEWMVYDKSLTLIRKVPSQWRYFEPNLI